MGVEPQCLPSRPVTALRLDPATTSKADAIVYALTRHEAGKEMLAAATEVAQAELELLQIREARAQLMAELDLASPDLDQLRRLAALDRYERFAATKQRRAARKLWDLEARREDWQPCKWRT